MSLPPPTGLPQPPAAERSFCYRHPNREAGRRCTRCGRPACTECLVRADIGSQCVECARKGRPPVRTRAFDWSTRQPILVTYVLIGINLAVFAWMVIRDPRNLSPGQRLTQEQIDLGLNEQLVAVTDEWYRIVSSAFLHFGIFHLLLNMLLLFQLGLLLEPTLGRVRFILLYIASMLGGSAGVLLLHPNERSLHGGASGAVFGLLGAAAVIMFRRGINPLSTGIGMTIALNLFITFTIPGISIGGHIGGLVAGAAAGSVMAGPRHTRQPQWVSYVAPVAVSVVAVVVSMMVTNP
jgi:membrane associated rhomboid family serine protease